ncbi:MAG: peptidylprolyl isomerase [Aquabacterium sp.]|nr:peptidylprolyl isomerase [Aquabacterium sp.]
MTHTPYSSGRRPLAWALAALLACASVQAQTTPGSAGRAPSRSGDFIVAVVNTELVTAVELQQRLDRIRADARRDNTSLPDEPTLRQQVLDVLIDERVQITHAREIGQKVDDGDIDRAVANIAAQNQITVAQLRDRLRADGMDLPRFRSNLREQIQVERLREREVNQRIRITDADIDRGLAERQVQAAAGAQINLAQILVTVPEGAAASVVAQRQARADQALARLRAGEDFTKVARELSEDANREAGGELGMRPADRLPDLFTTATAGLQVGQFTPALLRSAAGFHILKVLDRQSDDPFKVTQTRARHILVRASDAAQAAQVGRRLESVRAQIERGERKFDDTAREISEDGSATAGGDLGWASPGNFVPEFEEAMNRLPLGGISPPVASRFGVHLIQVVERRSATLDPKEVREQVRSRLRESKFESTYLEWAKELRLRAYVEMREPPI